MERQTDLERVIGAAEGELEAYLRSPRPIRGDIKSIEAKLAGLRQKLADVQTERESISAELQSVSKLKQSCVDWLREHYPVAECDEMKGKAQLTTGDDYRQY